MKVGYRRIEKSGRWSNVDISGCHPYKPDSGGRYKEEYFFVWRDSNFLYFPKLNVCGRVISIPRPTILKKMGVEGW
jgi:hypothetical protein